MLFAIYTEDKDNSLHIRKANRDAHIEYLSGFNVMTGGPIFNNDGVMVGSVVVLDAADKAAAEAYIAGDPYNVAGLPKITKVWEWKQSVGSISIP